MIFVFSVLLIRLDSIYFWLFSVWCFLGCLVLVGPGVYWQCILVYFSGVMELEYLEGFGHGCRQLLVYRFS